MPEELLLDPSELSRRVAEAARAWWAVRDADWDPEEAHLNVLAPHRGVSGLDGFDAAGRLHESDPLRAPLRRWIYRLAEARINHASTQHIAALRRQARHEIATPRRGTFTLAEMVADALTEPQATQSWFSTLRQRAQASHEGVRLVWQRRQEIARRMGLASPDDIELPGTDAAEVARRWLTRTDDLAEALRREHVHEVVELSLGRDAAHGWPGHLSATSLTELFRGTRLFDDVHFDVPRLPEPIAASSFLRGLEWLGSAWGRAVAAQDQPFVVAHDPYELSCSTLGSMFALLPALRPFARQRMDVGPARLEGQRRGLARVVLMETRARALRVLLRGPALLGARPLRDAFEERTERAFGCHAPADLAGVVWQLDVCDAQRMLAPMLAATRIEQLTSDHDEDWFRNPRGIDQLRSEAGMPPRSHVDDDAVRDAERALYQWLRALLD